MFVKHLLNKNVYALFEASQPNYASHLNVYVFNFHFGNTETGIETVASRVWLCREGKWSCKQPLL